jgi:AraC-like DNA-binding protein
MNTAIKQAPQPVAATPMAFVRAMLLACQRLGHDPSSALAAAQIQPAVTLRTDACITAIQMERLSDQLMRALDDEALGWFSRRLPWGSYGMLARASITAPTLRIALQRWCRHHALLTDDLRLTLVERTTPQGLMAVLSLEEAHCGPWLRGEWREFCHVSLLRNALGLSSWLVDSRIPLHAVHLAYDVPNHASAYGVLFNGPCHFGATCTQLSFDHHYLDLPLRRDETALRHMLQRALPLTVHTYRKDRLLVNRVRQTLAQHPETLRNAHALADHLHTSVRTLHRQLKEEGSSLQTLKDHVRQDLATRLLLRTQQPIKKIALAVGFDNDKSFIRAFRDWTGQPPEAFRKSD